MSIIRGVRRLDFPTDDGKQVKGYTVYYSDAMIGNDCVGEETEKKFVRQDVWEKLDFTPAPGDHVVISYDKKGKVQGIMQVQVENNINDGDYYDTEDDVLIDD